MPVKRLKTTGSPRMQSFALHATAEPEAAARLRISPAKNPLPRGTLGDTGISARVTGPAQFPLTILVFPFGAAELTGLDRSTIRVFRWDADGRTLKPVWNSGINVAMGFIWAKIMRPGLYVPIGLARDRLVQELIQAIARARVYSDRDSPEEAHSITANALALFLDTPDKELNSLREIAALVEVQTGFGPAKKHLRVGKGAHLHPFPLPGDVTLSEFKARLARLQTPPGGLPEEALVLNPELLRKLAPPWPRPQPSQWPGIDRHLLDRVRDWEAILDPARIHFNICWFLSNDWWMYHQSERHPGVAAGCSDIRSTNVGTLHLSAHANLDGPVITIPTVVGGKVYVGTSNRPGGGGTMYQIDVVTGHIDGSFTTIGTTHYPYTGIGGSPAVVHGKVYFTGLHCKVYCLDAATMTQLWMTDIRNPDAAHNQPVSNPQADCWASPLVVNNRVYVGSGEGEGGAFGFVYCLDANTGHVIWLFCTNKFSGVTNNSPNVLPSSAAGLSPLPAGFTTHADPTEVGVSVWSSLAYDNVLNRVYVGTGNASFGDFHALPDPYYGSGVLALDADTGVFRGFWQPSATDNYRPTDSDVDVCGAPTIVRRGDGSRAVAVGTKGGVFVLLDPASLTPVAQRQVLPYRNNDPTQPLAMVDMDADGHVGENMFGVFGTAAIHYGLGRLYIGLGGYGGSIDSSSTPFMRALDWNTLADTWHIVKGGDNVWRYDVPKPPMYTTPSEAGLSSPAVVNDVVFVSTTKPALYALCAVTGLCLWPAPGLGGPVSDTNILGPAIYGNYVVIGSGSKLMIYSL